MAADEEDRDFNLETTEPIEGMAGWVGYEGGWAQKIFHDGPHIGPIQVPALELGLAVWAGMSTMKNYRLEKELEEQKAELAECHEQLGRSKTSLSNARKKMRAGGFGTRTAKKPTYPKVPKGS